MVLNRMYNKKGTGKGTDISMAPHRKKLTSEALGYGSHNLNFYTANTSYLHPVSVHQMASPLASNSSRLIAAYYSFINAERMKG